MEAALRSPPHVSFSSPTVSVNEAAGSVDVGLQLSAPSPLTVRVPILPLGTLPGFAGGTAEFAPGSTRTSIQIPILQDSTINSASPRTVSLQIGLPEYANQGIPATVELRIEDDDRPRVGFSVLDQDVAETRGAITITAVSDRPFGGTNPVTVNFSIGGSAVNSSDYNLSAQSFSFNPGSNSASITLTPLNNSSINTMRNAVFTMTRSSNSPFDFISGKSRSQVVILDDEGSLRIGFAPTANGSVDGNGTTLFLSPPESAGNILAPVVLSRPTTASVSIPVTVAANPSAIQGTDFIVFTRQVTIPAGSVRGNVSFSIIDNLNFKGSRSFSLVLGTPSNGATLSGINRLTVTINENDSAPTIQFENSLVSRNETSGALEIPVSLSSLITSKVDISASIGSDASGTVFLGDAIRDSDFSVVNASASILAGSARGILRINLLNDALNEDTESVVAALNSGTAPGVTIRVVGRSRTEVDILDDDPNVTIQWSNSSQTVDESAGKALLLASINQAAGKNVHVPFTLSGTAELGVHHDLTPREIIIPKGETQVTLEIPLVADSTAEADKTLIITLEKDGNALLGSNSTHTLTITDASGFIPSITAFQSTVYSFVRSQACYSCHKPGGSADFAPFASDNLQDAFNAAVSRANFTTISNSLLVTKLSTPTHQNFSGLTQAMINQITSWRDQSSGGTSGGGTSGTTGSSGTGGSSPYTLGSAGIQDFLQIEATLSNATQIPTPSLGLTGTYHILRANISADGDPLGISAPMAGAYIGLGGHYCKAMIDEVSGSSSNKRGFDQIQGLSNFNVIAANFSPALQTAVAHRFAELFLQRQATPEEITELLSLVTDLKASSSTLTTKVLGTAMCSAIAGSVEGIDN